MTLLPQCFKWQFKFCHSKMLLWQKLNVDRGNFDDKNWWKNRFIYLYSSFRSSWCPDCTMLKSSLASSSKVGFMSFVFAYASMNHLVSNLSVLQWSGSSNACLANISRFSSFLCCCWMYSLRFFIVKSLASSKILSSSIEWYEASYRERIPSMSSLKLALNLPASSSLKPLKTSASMETS